MLILVVEDDDATREVLSECLRENGLDVISVRSGREALQNLESLRPDVILLDLLMADMNGWQFRLEQRRRPALAKIPVVIITALPLANMASLPQASACTMDAAAVVSKPFTVDAVTDAILRAAQAS
jgi:CheY-like chemotaxis protein